MKPVWRVPAGTLSNAGRLVVLRGGEDADGNGKGHGSGHGNGDREDVRAVVVTDAQLRGVVFGDPVMHMMRVYARRVEGLATRAVTARGLG